MFSQGWTPLLLLITLNTLSLIAMETTMHYIARSPIFETEKAFDTDFPVDNIEGARGTNHTTDARAVIVHPIQDPTYWDLDVHGFCVLKEKTHLDPQDAFSRKREVQKDYWFEIEAILHEVFPRYSRIESYDCTVCSYDFCSIYFLVDFVLFFLLRRQNP
jgi:hypothetical protein